MNIHFFDNCSVVEAIDGTDHIVGAFISLLQSFLYQHQLEIRAGSTVSISWQYLFTDLEVGTFLLLVLLGVNLEVKKWYIRKHIVSAYTFPSYACWNLASEIQYDISYHVCAGLWSFVVGGPFDCLSWHCFFDMPFFDKHSSEQRKGNWSVFFFFCVC